MTKIVAMCVCVCVYLWVTALCVCLCVGPQPCVIFMDEIDAIGGRRFSEGTSADRSRQSRACI